MLEKVSLGAVIAAILVLGAARPPPASAAAADDACALLTQAQLGAALNVAVGAGSYQIPTHKQTCTWNATGTVAKGAKYVTLMLEGADAYAAGKRTGPMKTISITPVSGIGNDAFYLTANGNVGLNVRKGKVAFKIAVYGDLPLDKKQAMEKSLAQQVVSKL